MGKCMEYINRSWNEQNIYRKIKTVIVLACHCACSVCQKKERNTKRDITHIFFWSANKNGGESSKWHMQSSILHTTHNATRESVLPQVIVFGCPLMRNLLCCERQLNLDSFLLAHSVKLPRCFGNEQSVLKDFRTLKPVSYLFSLFPRTAQHKLTVEVR